MIIKISSIQFEIGVLLGVLFSINTKTPLNFIDICSPYSTQISSVLLGVLMGVPFSINTEYSLNFIDVWSPYPTQISSFLAWCAYEIYTESPLNFNDYLSSYTNLM